MLGQFNTIINFLKGFFDWLKWFLTEGWKELGQWFTRFWGFVVMLAAWIWVCLEFIWGKLEAIWAHIDGFDGVAWPSWTNTVGEFLRRVNYVYPLEEHFECYIMLLALMAFLAVLKLLRAILL